MPDQSQPGALPLRPLTTGEVLDAAVVLLRTRPRLLIGIGAALALIEQGVLYPLRRLADVDSWMLPGEGLLGIFGLLIVVGFGTEALCIALLGGAAATHAPRALLGPAAPPGHERRFLPVFIVAVLAGLLCAASAWSFLVLPVPLQIAGLIFAVTLTYIVWPFVYGLVGLCTPAVVIDGRGPIRGLFRSIRLAGRTMMRAGWIRILGYIAWFAIRIGLSVAAVALLEIVYTSPSTTIDNIIMGACWFLVNALAYPVLGCLDVALYLDTRMRTEGLDIALRRSLRRGVATDLALALPRRRRKADAMGLSR